MAEEYIDNFESLINEAMHIADAVRSISKNLFYINHRKKATMSSASWMNCGP